MTLATSQAEPKKSIRPVTMRPIPETAIDTARGRVTRSEIASEIADANAACFGSFRAAAEIIGKTNVGPNATMAAMMCRNIQSSNQDTVSLQVSTDRGSVAPVGGECQARSYRLRVASSIVLPLRPQDVWDVLLRWEEQPRWMRDADSVRVLTPAREGVGTWIAVRTRVLDVPLFTEELEVVLWDPPRRLVMAHRSFVRGVGTWALRPEGSGTRFTWIEELSLPVPVVGELALLVYRPFMRRLMGGALADLSRLLALE